MQLHPQVAYLSGTVFDLFHEQRHATSSADYASERFQLPSLFPLKSNTFPNLRMEEVMLAVTAWCLHQFSCVEDFVLGVAAATTSVSVDRPLLKLYPVRCSFSAETSSNNFAKFLRSICDSAQRSQSMFTDSSVVVSVNELSHSGNEPLLSPQVSFFFWDFILFNIKNI